MAHWTAAGADSFVQRVTFDFWTQIQKRMELMPLSQFEVAQMFGVSESAVSQTLNNSRNPTLRTLFNYAQAAKLKVAIVAYDDDDPRNERGPVNSEIFSICWAKAGQPRTFGQANRLPFVNETALTSESLIVPARKRYLRVDRQYARTQQSDTPAVFFWSAGASFPAAQVETMATAINMAESRKPAVGGLHG